MDKPFWSVTHSSFKLGWTYDSSCLVIFLGWWWVCYGSPADRRASIAASEHRYQRARQQQRAINRIYRAYRPRRRAS